MTDYEAFKWILHRFKSIPRDFNNSELWIKFEDARQHFIKAYPESPYCELLERLQHSLYETATIYYIVFNIEGLDEYMIKSLHDGLKLI